MLRLNDVIGSNNIFAQMETNHVLPWDDDDSINSTLLMFEYLNNYSGRKITSPAVDNNLDDDNMLTTSGFATLCDVAYMMYSKKWARNWAVLITEYNPIENYSMTEHTEIERGNTETNSGSDSTTHTGTDTLAHSGTDTETHTGTDATTNTGNDVTTHSGSHTNTRSGSESDVKTGSHADAHTGTLTDDGDNGQTNQVSAFNSSGFENATKSTGTVGNERTYNDTVTTTYNSETDTHNYTNVQDTTTYNNEAETLQHGLVSTENRNLTDSMQHGHTETDTKNLTDQLTHGHIVENEGAETIDHTRSGNIGVTTSQQMLESDITLWKWNFFYEVFSDIDSIFTISTY